MSGSTRGFVAVGSYGIGMLLTGVVAVAGPAGASAIGAAPGRAIQPAPVVAPSGSPGAQTVGSPTAAGGPSEPVTAPVQEAGVGRARAVRNPFRPTSLILWDGLVAPVVPAGVRPDGSLVVPDDPAQVGWWTGGAQAGEAFGRIVVAGHVDSAKFGLGVLVGLAKVRTGQVVVLRAGARAQRYRVVARREVPQADLAKDGSIFRQDTGHRLVLITCGGRFDPVTHRYANNLIVEAAPLA